MHQAPLTSDLHTFNARAREVLDPYLANVPTGISRTGWPRLAG
jgi:hypothetical protein